jgi:hypothetical protein
MFCRLISRLVEQLEVGKITKPHSIVETQGISIDAYIPDIFADAVVF